MVLHSYVQLKPDPVIPINEADGFFYVVLIDMYVSHVQSNGFQGKLYLPCHQIQVIKVRGKPRFASELRWYADMTSPSSSIWNCTRLRHGAWLLSTSVAPKNST